MDVITPQTPLTVGNILRKFAKENPWCTVVYFIVLIVIPLQDVGLPHVYGRVVQSIQNKESLVKPFIYLVVMIVIIQVAVLINEWNETYYTYPALSNQIRKDMIQIVFDGHETNFDEQHTGSLIAKMIKLPTVLYNLVDQYKLVLVPQIIVCVTIIAYFAWKDAKLGIAMLISLIIIVAIVNMAPVFCSKDSCNREEIMNEIHDRIDDILRNMMAIYNADSLSYEEELVEAIHQSYVQESKNTITCIMNAKSLVLPVQLGLFCYFMWRCYYLLEGKKIDTGSFVSLFFIMLSFIGSIGKYIAQTKELVMRKGVIDVSLRVLEDVMDSLKTKEDYKKNAQLPIMGIPPPPDTAIYFDDVTYTYPVSTSPTIKNMTLVIPNGQRVLIVGRIGCGKSTLMRLIMKYKLPDKGQIYLLNKPYSQLSPKMIRATVGYVPQMPVLFERSIYDNITYGMENYTKAQMVKLLESLNLNHIFDSFPDGIDANVGKNGTRLSGGQRQIVWILRVLLQNPSVLLMDEPTASIDDKTKDTVRELLTKVMQGRTVVMVTHDSYLERFADRVVEMSDGMVISDTITEKKHQKFF